MVKFFLSDKVCEAARLSVDIHASYGVMRDYPVERIYRDAIIAPQIEGINDVQKVIYANSLLR
jgi:alkylation response protein AidB-like acyl-CoA dehydrogenase